MWLLSTGWSLGGHRAERTTMKLAMVLAVTLGSLLILAGCDGEPASIEIDPIERSTDEPANDGANLDSKEEHGPGARARVSESGATAGNERRGSVARAGGAGARAGYASTGEAKVVTPVGKAAADSASEQVTVKLTGDPGVRFSGECTAGDEEKAIAGSVPERYVYVLRHEDLECEIRKQSTRTGTLQIALVTEDNLRSAQQIDARRSTISLSYSDGAASSASSSSTNQTITSSVLSSSSRSP